MHVNSSAPPSFLLSDLKAEHLEHLKVRHLAVGLKVLNNKSILMACLDDVYS